MGGFGEFAGGFDHLLGQVVANAGFVAGDCQVCGTEQLLFAISQRVADSLLHLRIGDVALAGGFARH